MSVGPRPSSLYLLADPDWRRKLRRGGWLLFVPFVGWPLLLSFRKALAPHFFEDRPTGLPDWTGRHREHLANGLRAMGVILGYTAPVHLMLYALAFSRGWQPGLGAVGVAAFFVALPFFSNFAFPTACLLLASPIAGEARISPLEATALLAAFSAAIFLIPAGFLRVSSTGRFRSAFDLRRSLPFIARQPRGYLAAWWYGAWMNWTVPFALPLAPWGVFWAYIASMALFNELLLEDSETEATGGWLARVVADPRFAPAGAWGLAAVEAADGPARVLHLPVFSVPLPGRPS
ncbi:DUF4013 domain-containing protein [Engelhardtia mirabilis]|uniref:DUF4013 domain-containing protein n=1 Tax=Engelhardtia mirabilis TaxID=2528011 RepID=A0A518BIK3_9BACT|nr:hypothetical protein Pla133_18700 [Planctomycetes bacterium Pla133]QDV01120.1 hypothetical protein Pla86_18690 [Planctomycetes bacterium Pla86]